VFFGGRGGFEKYWRRKELTVAQARYMAERASLAPNVGCATEAKNGSRAEARHYERRGRSRTYRLSAPE